MLLQQLLGKSWKLKDFKEITCQNLKIINIIFRFMSWEVMLPDHWHLDQRELLEFDEHDFDKVQLDEWNRMKSVTQSTKSVMHKGDDGQMINISHFCFPFDLQLQVKQAAFLHRFPVLVFQLNSLDSWERYQIEGYGMIEIPRNSGFHELNIPTFKPNDDMYTKVYQYFLGGSIKIKEMRQVQNTLFNNNLVTKISQNNVIKQDVDTVLNRFSLQTESSGNVKIRVNVATQITNYQEEMLKKYEEEKHMQEFQKVREHKRNQVNGQSQTANIPTTLIKTQTGFVNRFASNNLPFQ